MCEERRESMGCLEVRKTRELGDVRDGGSRSGLGERQISGGGETEEGGNLFC